MATWRADRETRERLIRKELAFHIEEDAEQRVRDGHPLSEARRSAQANLGSTVSIAEAIQESATMVVLEQLWYDVARGLRMMWRNPVEAWSVIALLSLTIGLTTTIFSIANALVSRPAPGVTAEMQTLARLEWVAAGSTPDRCCFSVAEYQRLAGSLTGAVVAAYRVEYASLKVDNASIGVVVADISPNYFDVLAVGFQRGSFNAEARALGGAQPVIISSDSWRRDFGERPDIVGAVADIDGIPAVVIGVASENFQGAAIGETTSVWRPLSPLGAANSSRSLTVLARLAPGVTLPDLAREVTAIGRVDENTSSDQRHATARPYSAMKPETALADAGPMFIGVIAVLSIVTTLVVCANVSTLLLVRAIRTQRTVALRAALGATRARVLRVHVIEIVVLATVSLAVGWVMCYAATRAIWNIVPPAMAMGNRIVIDATPDARVFVFALAIATLATGASVLGPAAITLRQSAKSVLADTNLALMVPRARAPKILLVIQSALSVMLVAQSAVMLRAGAREATLPLGDHPQRILIGTVTVPRSIDGLEALHELRAQMLAEERVDSVSFKASSIRTAIRDESGAGRRLRVDALAVGPSFRSTLGIPLVAGADVSETPPGQGTVRDVLITESLADSMWPSESALGRTLMSEPDRHPYAVVGVLADGYYDGMRGGAPPPLMLMTAGQSAEGIGLATMYVQFNGDLSTMETRVKRVLDSARSGVAMVYLRSLSADVEGTLWPYQVFRVVVSAAAFGSVLLTAVGQFALSGFLAQRRQREWGLRMSLGATPRRIVEYVVLENSRQVGLGVLIGGGLSLIIGRVTASLVMGVDGWNVGPYIFASLLVGALSLVAAVYPVVRVLRSDPARAIQRPLV